MAERTPIPVVAVVGKSDSGKTTVLEGLIAELSRRGWRVATVKRHVHDDDVDTPGKDSWRHERAGAVVSMVSAASRLGTVRRVARERTLAELASEVAGEADILLAEGFKTTAQVRIEVSRDARSLELVSAPAELFALVTDGEREVGEVPTFPLDDIRGLAEHIERTFLGTAPGEAGVG